MGDEDGLCADVDPCPDLLPDACTVPVVLAIQVDTFPADTTWALLNYRSAAVLRGSFEAPGEGAFHEVDVRADTQSCVSLSDLGQDGGTRGLVFARTGDGEVLVVAEPLLRQVLGTDIEILVQYSGRDLELTPYSPPFDLVEVPDAHFVVLADYVTVDGCTAYRRGSLLLVVPAELA